MAWSLSTETILDQIRDAIGTSTTVGSSTLTWKWKLEGPPLRWLAERSDYPAIVLEPGDTEGTPSTTQVILDLPVTIYVIVKVSRVREASPISAKVYEMVRQCGEAVLADIMDKGNKLGGSIVQDRDFVRAGVDYDTTDEVFDDGLAVYAMEIVFNYIEANP